MLRHEPYFFINGIAVVPVNRYTTRKLPEPWPCLLNGAWDYLMYRWPWQEVFTTFLIRHGEDPSNFELHHPNGLVQRICWDPDRKCWGRKFVRDAGVFLCQVLPWSWLEDPRLREELERSRRREEERRRRREEERVRKANLQRIQTELF
jgi:hypothetical protein